ncbi:MAG: hypothetical protein ABTQ26_01570, partial [Azonexus sp.]
LKQRNHLSECPDSWSHLYMAGISRFVAGEAFVKLQQSKGKNIEIKDHSPIDNKLGYAPRAAQIGNYDGKGVLTIAIGHVGKPITGPADIVSKETYTLDPKVFDAFCTVFNATMVDTEAVKSISNKAKKLAIVEVDFDL